MAEALCSALTTAKTGEATPTISVFEEYSRLSTDQERDTWFQSYVKNANLRVNDKKRPRPKEAVAMAPPKRRYEEQPPEKSSANNWGLSTDNGIAASKEAALTQGGQLDPNRDINIHEPIGNNLLPKERPADIPDTDNVAICHCFFNFVATTPDEKLRI